jgi:hypothetical protein
MYYTGGAKKIEQTFVAGRDFDTITFWLTKEDLTKETGEMCEIVLTGEKTGEIFREAYDTRSLTRVDEYTKTFGEVRPVGNERFTLSIERTETASDNPIGVGAYDLPVEAYQYGAFYEDGQELPQEMFFTVTDGGPDSVIRLYD